MPSFKPKNKKIIEINQKDTITLDCKHREITNKIKKEKEEILPKLKEEKLNLKKRLKEKNLNIEEILNIKDELNNLNKKIKTIEKYEKKYYLDNSKHVFSYFENKQNIVKCKKEPTILDQFFNVDNLTLNNNYLIDKDQTNVQQYLSNIDETLIDINNYVVQSDICKKCEKGEMIMVENEGILVCNNCSHNEKYLIDNDKPSYKEPPKEVCFYAYKRINHFREILAQFQAKETTLIPNHVLEHIKLQIKRERLLLSQLTNKKAKEILKKLGYNKYYEHIPFIKDKLGIKPPIMSPELEELLCNLFMDIQAPYAKYCPDDRVNFLNYYYTVYKLCELLGERQYLKYFPMLKEQKKIEQDDIWKKICNDLGWDYIPTL